MLKLNTSFRKTVPIPDQEFSSQSFYASIEVELSDALKPAEIKSRIHDTFTMVKAAVEDELNGQVKTGIENSNIPENSVDLPSGSTEKASNRQCKFIIDLAAQQHIPISELNARVKELYKATNIYDMTRKDASRLLDSLKKAA